MLGIQFLLQFNLKASHDRWSYGFNYFYFATYNLSRVNCGKSCGCSIFLFKISIAFASANYCFHNFVRTIPKREKYEHGRFFFHDWPLPLDKEIWLLRPPSFLARRPGDNESCYGFSNQFLLDIQFFFLKKVQILPNLKFNLIL